MQSGMQDDWGLIVTKIIDYAAKVHGNQKVISRCVEDPNAIAVSTYRQVRDRAALCTLALRRLGIQPGDRVATLAWNTTRHIEAWYGIPGCGAVCHTLNPRLFDKELEYIINHAEDRIIMADISFVETLQRILPKLPTVECVIFLTDMHHMKTMAASLLTATAVKRQPRILCYEEIIGAEIDGLREFEWTSCREDQACGLCYTSGTTGNPKGVLYSHRSNFLLALTACLPDALNIDSTSSFLVLVPMFHANAWGITFAAPFVGGKLILPGPYLDGASIYSMMETHRATHTAGVPTVFASLMEYLDSVSNCSSPSNAKLITSLKIMVVGGAPCPRHMMEYFERGSGHKIHVRHMWGMTELSPCGSLGAVKGTVQDRNLDYESLMRYKLKQGWPLAFVEMRIVDDSGTVLPQDGKTFGHLQVRGPHTLKTYYRGDPNKPATDSDGWFDTGDVATLDEEGYMAITDRAKDVIKSGGEWISSIEIENLASGHPGVTEAAVIGVAHEKWGERPVLVVVARKSEEAASRPKGLKEDILKYLEGKIAKWWMPDDVIFVDSIPHTATGKISKVQLRNKLKEYSLCSDDKAPKEQSRPQSKL